MASPGLVSVPRSSRSCQKGKANWAYVSPLAFDGGVFLLLALDLSRVSGVTPASPRTVHEYRPFLSSTCRTPEPLLGHFPVSGLT